MSDSKNAAVGNFFKKKGKKKKKKVTGLSALVKETKTETDLTEET